MASSSSSSSSSSTSSSSSSSATTPTPPTAMSLGAHLIAAAGPGLLGRHHDFALPAAMHAEILAAREREQAMRDRRVSGERTVGDAMKEFTLVKRNKFAHRSRRKWNMKNGEEVRD